MKEFLFGYWLGSSGNDDSSSNGNGGGNAGCIMVVVVGIAIIWLFNKFAKSLDLTVMELFFTIVGIPFIPSAWDWYWDIAVGQLGLKLLISAGNIVGVFLVAGIIMLLVYILLKPFSSKEPFENPVFMVIGTPILAIVTLNIIVSGIRCIYYLYQIIF